MEGAFKWLTATPEPVPNTSFTVKGLKEDMVYEFRVAAHNKAGVGAFSNNSSPVKAQEPIGMFSSLLIIPSVFPAIFDDISSVAFPSNQIQLEHLY